MSQTDTTNTTESLPEPPPPRIAIVLPPREMFSPGATGAVGLVVHRLALHPHGINQTIYGMPTEHPFTEMPFQPVRLPLLPLGQSQRYAAGLTRVFRDELPHLIEVHNRPDVALHLALTFKRTPVLLVLHNDPQGMRAARTPEERKLLVRRMAAVAPVSRYLAVRLTTGAAPSGRIEVLPNCIDLDNIPRAERMRTILFAGRVVADKGADSFVAACALALPRLPGWRAEMIGADRFGADSPDTPFLRKLRPKADAAGVVMSGWKPHPEVLAAMASAAMVVVPSRWNEPFGLTALEAMACGTPLLCAPRGGLAELVGEAAIPINPEDPAAMADAMVELAQDKERWLELSAACRARAEAYRLPDAAARLAALRRALITAWSTRITGII